MLEQEIEAARALALGALARWEASEAALRGLPEYPGLRAQAREAYARHLKETNDRILKYNYSSPFALRSPIPFAAKRRLSEFDALYGADGESAE